MLTYNYNYYGVPTGGKFTNQNGDDIGDFVPMNIWGYYYDNATNWGKPLDESVYLWHLNPSCSYATNAAYSIATGNTLNIDIAYNQRSERVPLAMAASDVSGVDADYYKGFYTDPCYRLAYNDSRAQGYAHTALFYNVVYNAFCAVPRLAVYKADGSDGFLAATLDTLATTINASPSTRFLSYFRYDLYSGTYNNRAISEYYNESTYRTVAMPDILSDRPIPSTCTVVRDAVSDSSASPPHEPAWVADKVYSPFAAALCRDWSLSYTETTDNQYRVGFTQQYTPSYLRNGRGAYNGGRVTGQFFKYNPTIQDFDDVKYKWDIVIYDMTDKVFLQPGYDITSLSHNLRFMTKLTILDRKDAATEGEAVTRAAKHEMAYLGFYFADNVSLGATGILGSTGNGNGIYLPIFDDNNTTTGRYVTGSAIKDIPYCDADSVAPFQYKLTDTDDTGDWTYILNSGTIGAGVKYYALTEANMNNLCHWLNTTYNPTDETEFIQDFKGQNPGDYLVSVMYYPFDIPVETGTDETVVVGKLTATGSTGRVLKYKYGELYDFGSYTIPSQGNFIDYMRKISVIVPFCGTKDLDPIIWTGQTLTVKMAIDFPTGACTAFLFRGSHPMDTLSGTIGVPLPLSALSNGNYQVAITNMLAQKNQATIGGITRTASGIANITGGVLDMKNAGSVSAGGVASIISGTVTAAGGAVQTAVGLPNLEYNIEHTQPEIKQIDGGSPFINCGVDLRVKILICTPQLADGYDPAAYGKTTGFTCCKQGALKNVSKGFTVCAGAQLDGIQATATEKSMIYNALQGGVFV